MKKLLFSALAAALSGSLFAAPVALQNGYVSTGVSDYGTLGSNYDTSPGILFDPSGAGNYGVNDFLTPGTPFEAFYLKGNDGNYLGGSQNNGGGVFVGNPPTATSSTAASWSGSDGNFNITNAYNLQIIGDHSVINITTTLTNITANAFTNLQFLRTLDPDPDHNVYNIFDTDNSIVNGQACGTGLSSGQTICIGNNGTALTHQVGISREWTTNPSNYLTGSLNDGYGDNTIGLAFDIGNINAGDSVTLSYRYSLGGTLEEASSGESSVPEPGGLALMGAALLGLVGARRRKLK